ncbi:MAG TPA: hypothetical protein VJ558_04310 [Bacillales bacterium]|nr:hypothetical protein [Bacillales bacterium]
MTFAICVLMTWFVIIVFSLIPKKLTVLDMIFVYFVNTIFELSVFTILHINLKWLEVSHDVEKSLADLVLRIIMIPLVFVITANLLMYSRNFLKWTIVTVIIFSFLLIEALIHKLGILTTHHWNAVYTLVLFSSYTIFSSLMAWFISNVDKRGVGEN